MDYANETALKNSTYIKLYNDLKETMEINKRQRLELYKQKSKLLIALNSGIITCEIWFEKTLNLNKKENILNTEFCKISTDLLKLQNNKINS